MRHDFSSQNIEPMQEISALRKNWPKNGRYAVRKKRVGLPVLICVLVLILALMLGTLGFYWYRYQKSSALAEEGAFAEAKDCLILEPLTAAHDKSFIPYLDAGILLEGGQYDAAEAAFGELNGYRDSKDLALESRYRRAAEYADEDQFPDAIQAYAGLAEINYKDSARLLNETRLRGAIYDLYELEQYDSALRTFEDLNESEAMHADAWAEETKYQWALALWSREEWIESYHLLLELGDYKDAPELLAKIKELLYLKGKSIYLEGTEYKDALPFFREISPYERSEDYISLIDARRWRLRITNPPMDKAYGPNKFATIGAAVAALLKMTDFEDAASVLTDVYTDEYLVGTWESGDGSVYFQLEIQNDGHVDYYSAEYNLPWFRYGDSFQIKNGDFLVFPEHEYDKSKQLFHFIPRTGTEMDVYCYKDGSVHTLYKKQ